MRKLIKKHAVMMEYVIVAVLVAAVVVVAVIYFGRSVKDEFNVATTAMTDARSAEQKQTAAKADATTGTNLADEHAKTMNDYE